MKYTQLQERRIHGTFDFPLEFYHITPSHPRYEMSYHWHVEFELIRILKGEFDLNIDEQNFVAKQGDLVFIKDGALHGGIPKDCIYECIVFDLNSLFKKNSFPQKQMQKLLSHHLMIHYLFPKSDDQLHQIANTLFDAMRLKNEGYELSVIGNLFHLFGTIFGYHLYTEITNIPNKNTKRILQLKNALSLIESNYSSPLTLDDLAKAAGMNAKYFCRFFHEMTHRTPIDYLNYYRIEEACLQMITSDSTITEVALNCGFNDISYFIKTFKKYKGMTPKKYLSMPF
ncbi:MAG TPA: AraC family transcriptional regulator [Candidatus Merdenecus merdavium]|nr:AraC family transcriptional regulator [Candidatus Merdenecus merdavium]